MDTSETYVKMCEKAVEIQKLCPNEISEKDFSAILPPSEEEEAKLPKFKIICGIFVWLPRQDQLQEMMIETGTNINLLHYFVSWIDNTYNLCSWDSMEQLWLAFVMKERYSKVWNGEDWVKT